MRRATEGSALDGPLPRLLALALGVGCFAFIGLSWREQSVAPPVSALPAPSSQATIATPAPSGASAGECRERKQAEIAKLKAEGRLTAEQAMMRRQAIAKECP